MLWHHSKILWVKKTPQNEVKVHSQPKNSEWNVIKHGTCYQRQGLPQVGRQG